jgi:hypothetical protein
MHQSQYRRLPNLSRDVMNPIEMGELETDTKSSSWNSELEWHIVIITSQFISTSLEHIF